MNNEDLTKYDILVNKDNPLDKNYIPDSLVEYKESNGPKIDPNVKTLIKKDVLDAFYELCKEAKKCHYDFVLDSGYRSYDYQQKILDYYLEKRTPEWVEEYVAKPGKSEHQTGLAIDIAIRRKGELIKETNDDMNEIKWIQKNAWRYGFILRYPKGKEDITGYQYERWHIRFVGKLLAKFMHERNIKTLEEYHARYIKK